MACVRVTEQHFIDELYRVFSEMPFWADSDIECGVGVDEAQMLYRQRGDARHEFVDIQTSGAFRRDETNTCKEKLWTFRFLIITPHDYDLKESLARFRAFRTLVLDAAESVGGAAIRPDGGRVKVVEVMGLRSVSDILFEDFDPQTEKKTRTGRNDVKKNLPMWLVQQVEIVLR